MESIHINGFHATRTDKVIAELGITKGAFYHYFPDKLSLGYAVVDEILYPQYVNMWTHLEHFKGNIIDGIILGLQNVRGTCNDETIGYGCPLNNLIQEMAPMDDGFRARLNRIVDKELGLLSAAISKGKKQKQIVKFVDPKALAYFIFASIEGSFTLGKINQSKAVFDASIDQLVRYLETLKTKD